MEMRCFIAIELDERIRKGLSELAERLRRAGRWPGGAIKWVEPGQIHLTLKFFGEIEQADVGKAILAMDQTASEYRAFDVTAEGTGCFGRPARVIWAGMKESAELKAVQMDLERRLTAAGFAPDDKEFSAHLTLARVKNPAAARDVHKVVEANGGVRLGTFRVDAITLFQSELQPSGPVYSVVHHSDFKK
jgi:2'-5' RNA ligase